MPDPKRLKVGDRVRFVCLPDEWDDPLQTVPPESVEFMKAMIARNGASRVCEVDEYGTPWICARIRRGGKVEHHSWGILEKTGWRKVQPRA